MVRLVVECNAKSATIHQEYHFQASTYAAWAGVDFSVTTNINETRISRVEKGETQNKNNGIVL